MARLPAGGRALHSLRKKGVKLKQMKKTKKKIAPIEVVEVKESEAKQELRKCYDDYKTKYPDLYELKGKEAELERELAKL